MYNPPAFRVSDPDTLREFIIAQPLGLFITHSEAGLSATSLPFLCRTGAAGELILVSHLARANPHWKTLSASSECLIAFQGPHAYVTPSWYASKTTTHQVVPTWNYTAVQVRGTARAVDDADWLRVQVEALTQQQEQGRAAPWQVSDAPAGFIAGQLKAIAGLEVVVSDIDGKWKMNQNRSMADVQGVVAGLSDPTDPHHNAAVAELVAACNAARTS